MVELMCEYCGNRFEVHPYRADKAKFCSKSCSGSRPKLCQRKKPHIIGNSIFWKCCTCDRWLPEKEFYVDKRSSNGRKAQCKKCHTKTSINSRDPEKHRKARVRSESKMRAVRAGAPIHKFTNKDWETLIDIFGDKCASCGTTDYPTWDHINPISKGGAHHPTNIQRLCRLCNEKKQASLKDYRTSKQIRRIKDTWVVDFEVVSKVGRPQ